MPAKPNEGASPPRKPEPLDQGGLTHLIGYHLRLAQISVFRDFSEAKIRRMYADLGVKGDGNELHLNFTGADNFVGVTAAAPVQLLDLGWSRTFTSPQTTENKMAMVSANGPVKATPSLTFSGVGYYRWFQQ